jgi:hypothetical protein
MPMYVIEFGKFARFEGGDARGKGGTLVTRKRGDLIELSIEHAAEKHESVRLATAEEIAAGRALSMERNPLPLPERAPIAPSEESQEPSEPEPPAPAPVVEPVAPAPPPPPALSMSAAAPPAPAPPAPSTAAGNEQTPKPRETAGKKSGGSKKKTAGKKK